MQGQGDAVPPEGAYDGASHHARLLALGAALGSALHGGAPFNGLPPPMPSPGEGEGDGTAPPEVARMSSKYVGVHRSGKKRKPWTAACYWNGKQHHLGYFKTEEEAAAAYDAYVKSRGLERRVNFPDEGSEDKISAAEAKASSKITRGVASRFAGVHHSRSNAARPWRASCMSKRKYHHLGIYATEEEAALAYDAFVIEHNLGRELNFPQYRHMLQLGAAGAQSLGAVPQVPGVAPGLPTDMQQLTMMEGLAKSGSWMPCGPPAQPAPHGGGGGGAPMHPSLSSLMGVTGSPTSGAGAGVHSIGYPQPQHLGQAMAQGQPVRSFMAMPMGQQGPMQPVTAMPARMQPHYGAQPSAQPLHWSMQPQLARGPYGAQPMHMVGQPTAAFGQPACSSGGGGAGPSSLQANANVAAASSVVWMQQQPQQQ
jgi:hypothetical protein